MVSTLLVILPILLDLGTVPGAIDEEEELALETCARLCWELHELGLYFFCDLAVVEGLEGD
jgi:hypothetical protein